MNEALTIQEIAGPELGPWIDALGELRIRVFRDYPYLYEGSLAYERDYLKIYQNCERSRLVLVTNAQNQLIGATTCIPLLNESEEFQSPFIRAGHAIDDILYFGESIVLSEWRGHGLGKEFFIRREAHARRLTLHTTAFCAVDRPPDHPLRPAGFRPLDEFWQARGYAKQPSLQATFSWKEIGELTESPKTLTFWTKTWTA